MVREQILSAAFSLFSQYGIRKIGMNDIARQMNISKKTLYRFFANKESLLVSGLEYRAKMLFNLWRELSQGPYTVLDTLLLLSDELMKHTHWYTEKFFEELELYPKANAQRKIQNKLFEQQCLELIACGISEGVFEPDVNYGIVVKLAHKHLCMHLPSRSFAAYSPVEVYNTTLEVFLRGICTDKGRKILDRWYYHINHARYTEQKKIGYLK